MSHWLVLPVVAGHKMRTFAVSMIDKSSVGGFWRCECGAMGATPIAASHAAALAHLEGVEAP